MYISKVVVAVLAVRQLGEMLPEDYCAPQCPSCKTDIANFDGSTTSCTSNSSFLTDCSSCQQCILYYAIQNQIDSSMLDQAMVNVMNLCENTTVAPDVEALQSQASRISIWASDLTSTTVPSAEGTSSSLSITTPPSAATSESINWKDGDNNNPSLSALLATATWASDYRSHKSAESAASASLASASLAVASQQASAAESHASVNDTWVAGPVMGSLLGISTVFIVIFFTRRKHQKEFAKMMSNMPSREFSDVESDHSDLEKDPEKPQLHSECVEVKELDNCEVVEPVELPALEPVGSELNTPSDAKLKSEEDWPPCSPLPLSPLPLLFSMTEIRDERAKNQGPKHDTYYHP